MKFNVKYYASLESIFSDLTIPFTKGKIGPASALAADIVGIGDSWLKYAIEKAIIEPIRDVEDQEWFKSLNDKWKVTLYFVSFFTFELVSQDWSYVCFMTKTLFF